MYDTNSENENVVVVLFFLVFACIGGVYVCSVNF